MIDIYFHPSPNPHAEELELPHRMRLVNIMAGDDAFPCAAMTEATVIRDRYRHSLINLDTSWRQPLSCNCICCASLSDDDGLDMLYPGRR